MMKSKKIGITLIVIGILYLLLVSWLISWWYVPDYREQGFEFVSGSSWYRSIPFNIIWGISAPLGALMVILGFALYVKVERKRIIYFIAGSILLLFWLAMWYVTLITSFLYGIGGGIILLCFILSVRNWAKRRKSLPERNRLVSDIRVMSHLLFLIAAWGLCGLLGSPLFGLRPGLMIAFKTEHGAFTMGAKVMICLIFGWVLSVTSQYIDSESK
jgi:hypothetical protein